MDPRDSEHRGGFGFVSTDSSHRVKDRTSFQLGQRLSLGAIGGRVGRPVGASVLPHPMPKCLAVSGPPSETISARSTPFSNSWMLPGHRYERSRSCASLLSPDSRRSPPARRANRQARSPSSLPGQRMRRDALPSDPHSGTARDHGETSRETDRMDVSRFRRAEPLRRRQWLKRGHTIRRGNARAEWMGHCLAFSRANRPRHNAAVCLS